MGTELGIPILILREGVCSLMGLHKYVRASVLESVLYSKLKKLETGLRTNSAGIPYTLLSRAQAIYPEGPYVGAHLPPKLFLFLL